MKVWIGFNNLKTKAAFEWVDGSDVSFKYWAPGEPNNEGGPENCAELYVKPSPEFKNITYKWNDFKCDRLNNYVCRWNP